MAHTPSSPSHSDSASASAVTFQKNWYYYRDGKVSGPAAIDKIMDFGDKDTRGQRILVSKVGFEKWYPIDDLSELFEAQKNMELENALEIEQLKRYLADNVHRLQRAAGDHKVVKKTIETSLKKPNTEAHFLTAEPDAPLSKLSTPKAVSHHADTAKLTLNEAYVSIRGKQRLGRFRSALGVSFVHFPLSLGLSWVFWMRHNIFEMLWHVTGEYELKGRLLNPWLSLIPGLHFYFAYKLACLIRFAEGQDGYRATNPYFALWLATVPPFCMMYLQDQVNAHWRFHATKEWQRRLSAET